MLLYMFGRNGGVVMGGFFGKPSVVVCPSDTNVRALRSERQIRSNQIFYLEAE